MRHSDQGRRLIALLKLKPMTYLEMNLLGISTSPWRRIAEQLLPGEKLAKDVDHAGRTTWRVIEAKETEAA